MSTNSLKVIKISALKESLGCFSGVRSELRASNCSDSIIVDTCKLPAADDATDETLPLFTAFIYVLDPRTGVVKSVDVIDENLQTQTISVAHLTAEFISPIDAYDAAVEYWFSTMSADNESIDAIAEMFAS